MKKIHKQDIITDTDIKINVLDIQIADTRKKRLQLYISIIIHSVLMFFVYKHNISAFRILLPTISILFCWIFTDYEYINNVQSIVENNIRRENILKQLKSFKKDKKISD